MDLIHIAEIIMAGSAGLVLSAVVLPRISLVSFRCRLFDQTGGRKLHTVPIPRLGGVAFFPCIMMSVLSVIVFHNLRWGGNLLDASLTVHLFVLICSLFLLYLMGMMDDLVGVRYRSKFVVQGICGAALAASGFCIDHFHGLFGIHAVPAVVGIPFTVLVIVFILNAVNLIDGIDGLASGLGMIAFLVFGCMFARLSWWVYAYISFASFGVLVPFFRSNVFGNAGRGRKIFMGDTGSLTIGLLLAVLAIRLGMTDPVKDLVFPGAIVTAFSCLIVPMLDVVRVVIHRLRTGNSPFLPDRNHIHHKFIALGMTQRRAMVTIVGIALLFAVSNVLLVRVLSTTLLFLLDVAVWTVMHCIITVRINALRRASGSPDGQP